MPRHMDRLSMGMLIGAVVVALAYLGGWWWAAFETSVSFVAFKELRAMLRAKGVFISHSIILGAGGLLLWFAMTGKTRFFLFVITLSTVAIFLRLLFRQPRASIADIGANFMALFYVAFLPLHFVLLRNLNEIPPRMFPTPGIEPGLGFLVWVCAVIATSDIVAYYAGRAFGRTLLSPAISPKKTREGALTGLLGGVGLGLLLAHWAMIPLVHALALSILVILVGQLGDLSESLLKRDAGVKDSGLFLHSHGGVLDRIDSYIFSGAVAYYYIHWVLLREGIIWELFS